MQTNWFITSIELQTQDNQIEEEERKVIEYTGEVIVVRLTHSESLILFPETDFKNRIRASLLILAIKDRKSASSKSARFI